MRVRYRDIVEWLPTVRGFPRDCAEPFAALLAHYSRRQDPTPEEDEALRRALASYLDATNDLQRALDERLGHRGQGDQGLGSDGESSCEDELLPAVASTRRALAERNDPADEAELLAFRMDQMQGAVWPVKAGVQPVNLQWKVGIGAAPGRRSLTETNLLVCLGTLILAAGMKQVEALKLTLSVLEEVGVFVGGGKSDASSLSRFKRGLKEFLREHRAGDLSADEVRAAYQRVANAADLEASVWLPRAPAKGWTGRKPVPA